MIHRILIVDDEPNIRGAIGEYFRLKGFEVDEASSCKEAVETFRNERTDLVVADFRLPDGDALDLLPTLRSIDEEVPIVILTAHGSIDLAVRALKEGADHFLTKPVEMPALFAVARKLLEAEKNRHRQAASKSISARKGLDPFIGTSELVRRLEADARALVDADSTLLIEGETGTGKGVLARWFHQNGPRSEEPFMDLNCAGLSTEFLESELFGHEKGAYTGAVTSKAGLLEVAHRGTVFLDEIGDMDLQVQPKLLKVLEDKRIRRLGAVRDRAVDVRLVVATHQDLEELIREKKFRSDLYYRISTLRLRVPALRERSEDIPEIASRILLILSAETGRAPVTLAADAGAALQAYSWPGNVRELRNVLERALLLSKRPILDADNLQLPASHVAAADPDPNRSLEETERRQIEAVLRHQNGQVERAAEILGISRSSLYEKLRRYGITTGRR